MFVCYLLLSHQNRCVLEFIKRNSAIQNVCPFARQKQEMYSLFTCKTCCDWSTFGSAFYFFITKPNFQSNQTYPCLPSKHITFSKRFILVPVWFRFYKTFYERFTNVIKKTNWWWFLNGFTTTS